MHKKTLLYLLLLTCFHAHASVSSSASASASAPVTQSNDNDDLEIPEVPNIPIHHAQTQFQIAKDKLQTFLRTIEAPKKKLLRELHKTYIDRQKAFAASLAVMQPFENSRFQNLDNIDVLDAQQNLLFESMNIYENIYQRETAELARHRDGERDQFLLTAVQRNFYKKQAILLAAQKRESDALVAQLQARLREIAPGQAIPGEVANVAAAAHAEQG